MISAHRRGLGTPGVVAKDDGGWAGERRARKTIDEGVRDLVHQFREFLIALWLSPGRQGLALLTTGTVLVVCATAAAQVRLSAWNRPSYEAISARSFVAFLYQLLVFAAIAGGLLVNVTQAWLREMIKLRSREWLTRDLFAEWLKPGAPARLAGATETRDALYQLPCHIHFGRAGTLSAVLSSRLIGAAVTVDNDAYHVSQLFTATGHVAASLRDAANCLRKSITPSPFLSPSPNRKRLMVGSQALCVSSQYRRSARC